MNSDKRIAAKKEIEKLEKENDKLVKKLFKIK